MRKVGLILTLLLVIGSAGHAQFTIPNNTTPGIAADPQSVVMQADIDNLVRGISGFSGVVTGVVVIPHSAGGMAVDVLGGTAVVQGVSVDVTEQDNVLIATADASHPRVDLVRVDSMGVISVVTGTPAAHPKEPDIDDAYTTLAAVYVPTSATEITQIRIVDKRVIIRAPATSGLPGVYKVTDYGAVCNGATDDSTAFQATVSAIVAAGGSGVMVLPAGVCNLGTTLVLGDPMGMTTTYIGIAGVGPASSGLQWVGATTDPAIELVRNKYFRLQGFALVNGEAKGTTIGVLEAGFGGVGTETLGGVFDHVAIRGFHVDLQAGDSMLPVSASDIEYRYMELTDADYGWRMEELNTLNHVFHDLNLGGNDIGMEINTGNVYVDGGSTYANATADFYLKGGGGADSVSIRNVRAEVLKRFVIGGATNLLLDSNFLVNGGVQEDDDISIELESGNITLSNNYIQAGRVANSTTPNVPRFVSLISNRLHSDDDTNPILLQTPDDSNGGWFSFISQGNYRIETDLIMPSITGQILRGFPTDIPPTYYVTSKVTPTPTTNSNLNFMPGEINFFRQPSLSVATPANGRNMRVEVTFDTSGTATVLFKRDVLANLVMGVFQLTMGQIRLSDLGLRALVTPNGGDPESGRPQLITAVDVGMNTVTTNAAGSFDCGDCTPATVTIGEDEPDANYMLMMACDANENFWWSAKATTGFTLNSSNAMSTATCDVLIVR